MSTPGDESHPLRTAFFVDGFNVYHSLLAASRQLPGASLKWLDLPALLQTALPLIDRKARLASIHYFTAYAHHLQATDPQKIQRHRAYVRALTAHKVVAHVGKFQRRTIWCGSCQDHIKTYEEKETDVALACELLKQAARSAFDAAVLVTGDTDLAPAVRAFQDLHPGKLILFAFPFDRANRELGKLCPASFRFSKEAYAAHQFPERVRLPSGKAITKPDDW
jgi:uncharacterized LabA/DUF88 family protein